VGGLSVVVAGVADPGAVELGFAARARTNGWLETGVVKQRPHADWVGGVLLTV